MTAIQWAPAQRQIFGWIMTAAPAAHLVIEALAGSGKTTTMCEAMRHVYEDESVHACAFNTLIRDSLNGRVPQGVEVTTCHGFGRRSIVRAMGPRPVDKDATSDLVREHLGPGRQSWPARKAVCRLIEVAKGGLVAGPAALDKLADSFGIEFPDEQKFPEWKRPRLINAAVEVMRLQQNATHGPIDFDDMIWLPVVLGLPIQQFDWVFVDETQDLNPAQLEIICREVTEGGRIVAVGDRHQAIYGFRGADRRAIPRMIDRLSATVLPLSVTYRCGRAIVEEAQRYVPQLEAAPNAEDGEVTGRAPWQLEGEAQPGDFVISRTNAPLVSLCFKWIAEGRRATIRGRDIGEGLTSWIRTRQPASVKVMRVEVAKWRDKEVARLTEAERSCESVLDKAACLDALTEGCATVSDVLAKIERLFVKDGSGGIELMSTHKAKGLEADRVWMLRDTYRDGGGDQEEDNLAYVAITRAKRSLCYVTDEPPDGPPR